MNRPGPNEIARHRVVAHNYATASENRIHGDEVARRYGFAGGLVPGVASYAYLTSPALQLLGESWLGAGEISVKLVHPVYHGDAVEATARAAERAGSCELELRDSSGRVCATGSAAKAAREAPPEDDPLPFLTPPPLEARPAASLEELRPGRLLATLDVDAALRREGRDEATPPEELRRFLADRYRDPEPRYLDPAGPLHPALAPELANQVLARSVLLGPWIHAGSRTHHFAPLLDPAGLQARGRVAASYQRNGHDIVELDVRLYRCAAADPNAPRLVARVHHRAIVRPREVA